MVVEAASRKGGSRVGPPAGLHADLLTDWIPDAIGGADLDGARPLNNEFTGKLAVATRSGTKQVPVPSIEFRAWAHLQADAALTRIEPSLSRHVYGYRDSLTPYRSEWARLSNDQQQFWDAGDVCFRLDIKRFFESVDLAGIRPAIPSKVLQVMTAARDLYEQPLVPGHRWSRRASNLILQYFDGNVIDQADGRIQRWQDDYWIFAASIEEAVGIAESLSRHLAVGGLKASSSKFGRVERQSPNAFREELTLRSAMARAEEALRHKDVAHLKYLMRWFAERAVAEPLLMFSEVTRQFPVLVPRFAAWIAASASSREASLALREGLRTSDPWELCRLAASACHGEQLARAVPMEVIDSLADSEIPAARGLAARLQRTLQIGRVAASPRIDAALTYWSESKLSATRPIVSTTL